MSSVNESLNALKQNVSGALSKLNGKVNKAAVSVIRDAAAGEAIYVGDVIDFAIANYDTETEYVIGASHGTVELVEVPVLVTGEQIDTKYVVRLTTPTDYSGPITVSINTRSFDVTVESMRIAKPTIVSPTAGATNVSTGEYITSSAFVSKPAGQFTHVASSWEIATDEAFTNVIAQSTADTVNLESFQIPDTLDGNTVYYARVRHEDGAGEISEWSSAVSFTTSLGYLTGSETAFINPPTTDSRRRLGGGVAISGDGRTIAGVSDSNNYVLLSTYSGGTWSAPIEIPVGPQFDYRYVRKGISLNYDGTVMAVGNPRELDGGLEMGSVTIHRANGGAWDVVETIKLADRAHNDMFGYDVSLDETGNRLLASLKGRANAAGEDLGFGIVFDYSGGTWSETQRIGRTFGTYQGTMGDSVSLSGDGTLAVIGGTGTYYASSNSASGAIVVSRDDGGVWSDPQSIYVSSSSGSQAGASVDTNYDGTRIAVGVPSLDGNGQDAGYVGLVQWMGAYWDTFKVMEGSAGDKFGVSVAISGDGKTVLAGSRNADSIHGAGGTGVAYTYHNDGSGWTLVGALSSPLNSNADQFARSLDLSKAGTAAVVGAPYDDDRGQDSGSMFVFN